MPDLLWIEVSKVVGFTCWAPGADQSTWARWADRTGDAYTFAAWAGGTYGATSARGADNSRGTDGTAPTWWAEGATSTAGPWYTDALPGGTDGATSPTSTAGARYTDAFAGGTGGATFSDRAPFAGFGRRS